MAETATGVLVVTAIATSGHDDFAAENEIPIGPAVALSVHYNEIHEKHWKKKG